MRSTSAAMRTGSAAMRSTSAARAAMKRRIAVTSVRLRARILLQTLHLRPVRALTLDRPSQPALTFRYKVEDRRSPILAAVGGTGVLDSMMCLVPARELSLLLLPRAPEVCTRLGQTSTGRTGAWPGLPAGGRSHLSTSP